MRLLVINALVLVAVSLVQGQVFFVPGEKPNLKEGSLTVPGVVVDSQGSPLFLVKGAEQAEQRAIQQQVVTIMQPPLCLACTCKVGFVPCDKAGGVLAITTGIINAFVAAGTAQVSTCTPTKPCVLPAPPTLSACDSFCKKKTATCDPALTTNSLCDAEVDAANKGQCGTLCEKATMGDTVKCDAGGIRSGAINQIPPTCAAGRKRRDAESSEPSIESSQGGLSNSARFLWGLFNPLPSIVGVSTSTSTFTGAIKATYVLSDGSCAATAIPTC